MFNRIIYWNHIIENKSLDVTESWVAGHLHYTIGGEKNYKPCVLCFEYKLNSFRSLSILPFFPSQILGATRRWNGSRIKSFVSSKTSLYYINLRYSPIKENKIILIFQIEGTQYLNAQQALKVMHLMFSIKSNQIYSELFILLHNTSWLTFHHKQIINHYSLKCKERIILCPQNYEF